MAGSLAVVEEEEEEEEEEDWHENAGRAVS